MDDAVGSKLREARARRRLSLQEAEAATKIRVRYLQALENEEWDQLPGDTYARAFIRTYGSFLGLDGDRLAEEQRRLRGAERPGERLPRVDSRRGRVAGSRRGRRVSSGVVAVLVSALVVGALLAIGLWTGEDAMDAGPAQGPRIDDARAVPVGERRAQQPPRGHSLRVEAKAEVWVCLLDGRARPLVDGVILAPGEAVGPFRSGSFSLALGNGAVTMTVDGKQPKLPEPASPIGFSVSSAGSVRELPEGERPTCT